MMRVIMYDISENSKRSWISKSLEAEGFDRIQYSVFAGKMNTAKWRKYWKEIKAYFDKNCQADDRIFSIKVDRDNFRQMEVLGMELDKAWIMQEIKVWFA